MHYLFYVVDFWVYFAFCLLNVGKSQQLSCLFPERELLPTGWSYFLKKERLWDICRKGNDSNKFSKVDTNQLTKQAYSTRRCPHMKQEDVHVRPGIMDWGLQRQPRGTQHPHSHNNIFHDSLPFCHSPQTRGWSKALTPYHTSVRTDR